MQCLPLNLGCELECQVPGGLKIIVPVRAPCLYISRVVHNILRSVPVLKFSTFSKQTRRRQMPTKADHGCEASSRPTGYEPFMPSRQNIEFFPTTLKSPYPHHQNCRINTYGSARSKTFTRKASHQDNKHLLTFNRK